MAECASLFRPTDYLLIHPPAKAGFPATFGVRTRWMRGCRFFPAPRHALNVRNSKERSIMLIGGGIVGGGLRLRYERVRTELWRTRRMIDRSPHERSDMRE